MYSENIATSRRKEAHMNARAWRIGALATLVVSVAAFAGWGQAYPQGLIIDPPTSEVLTVSISTDKPQYQVGDLVTISYEVNKAAYIYIWDIMPTGEVQVVFPSASYPGGLDNFVEAGAHQLPRSFPVAPPYGTEYLQILATTQPVDIASFPMSDPGLFQEQVEVHVMGLLLEDERTWSFTSFEIIEGAPSNYVRLDISSTPSGASISIDGTFIGYTPRTHYVSQGMHRISISKSGYAPYETFLILFGTGTRTINPTLTPLGPTNAPPTASFTYSPPNPFVGTYVQFNANASSDSDGAIVSYSWSFGDGSTGSGPAIWHPFLYGGSFPVTLTVQDDDGATNSLTRTVQVGPTNVPPVASFTFTNLGGNWVQFNASGSSDSDGSIVSYSWNFGDGSAAGSGSVIYHPFPTASTFLVTLTVTDDDGATGTVSQSVALAPANAAPIASFAFTPVGSNWVRLDATASTDSDGAIISYSWNFGDGSAAGSGSVIYHPFPAASSYLVTLTVTDDDGATGTSSQLVDLSPPAQPPIAAFTHSPTYPVAGQLVTLNATGSSDPDGSIVLYRWDLNGDGLYDASGPIIQGSFGLAGVVAVRLDVTDDDGLTGSVTQMIVVGTSGGPVGAPLMGTTPGIFVWGTDRWHVTVNAGAGWSTPHAYRIELRTDGTFENVNDPSGSPVIPLGLTPTPLGGDWTVTFEGSILSGSVDYTFRVPDSTSIWMSLKLDVDGNGTLDETTSFVYLRHSLVRPPSVPMVVGLPRGSSDELLPGLDFRIGTAARYTEVSRWIFWQTTVSALESL
jgi:PKD repeat protein